MGPKPHGIPGKREVEDEKLRIHGGTMYGTRRRARGRPARAHQKVSRAAPTAERLGEREGGVETACREWKNGFSTGETDIIKPMF